MPVAEALDRVLEILRTTELYSPQLGTKEEDPHTSDLVGGLMTVSLTRPLYTQHKFNWTWSEELFLTWSCVCRTDCAGHQETSTCLLPNVSWNHNPLPSRSDHVFTRTFCVSALHHIPSHLTTPLSLNDIPACIAQTMENEDSWDFDILSLESATMKRYTRFPQE